MTFEVLLQGVISGLLMGFVYALIAAGLSLLLLLFRTQRTGRAHYGLPFLTAECRGMSLVLSLSLGRRRRTNDVGDSPPCETPNHDRNRQ